MGTSRIYMMFYTMRERAIQEWCNAITGVQLHFEGLLGEGLVGAEGGDCDEIGPSRTKTVIHDINVLGKIP